MTDTLMVGVSGIRGIVGKDLTDEVVGRYARAFGRWVKARTPVVVVGRDARESGPAFERAVVDGLGSVGCAVVKVGLVPTPTVQLAVEHHAAGGGIAITASHNPIEWNALKFIGPDGVFLDGADGARVLELAGEDGGGGGRTGKVTTDEGAVERHLEAVLKLPAVVDESGTPIGEDYTLAFVVRAVLGGKREKGNGKRVVVCNLSTSLVVEDAARDCDAEVVRTPVGEVHVARAILRLAAVIGGEGNGGVMYPALHAGRDAPVAAALLLTLLAHSGKRVSELVAAAPRYTIVKAKVERGAGSRAQGLTRVYAELQRRFPDARADTQDGLRLAWRDRWLHVRPSNTEPIIRLIAEAPSGAKGGGGAQELVDEARRICAAS